MADTELVQPSGCERCFPASAEVAWEARSQLRHVAELIDDSHYHVMVMACGPCGQHFVSVFTESIDWADGDDPQYWQLLPITLEESKRLCAGGEPDNATLQSIGPARRSLSVDHPKGGPLKIYWSNGLWIGYHD